MNDYHELPHREGGARGRLAHDGIRELDSLSLCVPFSEAGESRFGDIKHATID